jgi:hypothetical protein
MKVTVEMNDDAFDLIMVRALEEHIRYCYGNVYYLEEDVEWNEKLKQALWVVFEYFAGEEAVENLKKQVGGWS